jgi:hypothetical protein
MVSNEGRDDGTEPTARLEPSVPADPRPTRRLEPVAVTAPMPVVQPMPPAAPMPLPPRQLRTRRPFDWRLPVAILILATVVLPGVAVMRSSVGRDDADPATGVLAWLSVWGVVLFEASFIVFLAVVYVIAYVVSAAWHDAQNARRR